MDEDAREEYLDTLRAGIVKYGWMVQHVGPGDHAPAFSYTVGLTGKGYSELVVYGLPPDVAQPILNDLAGRLTSGTSFEHGQILDDVVQNFPVVMVYADRLDELSVAHVIAGPDRAVSAFQVVFPDATGRWPWEPSSRVSGMPVLGPLPVV